MLLRAKIAVWVVTGSMVWGGDCPVRGEGPPSQGASSQPQQCTFRSQPVVVGDVGEQRVDLDLRVERQLSQAGTEVGVDRLNLQRQQVRRMRVLAVDKGIAMRVQVTFVQARQSVEQPNGPPSEANPVEGESANRVNSAAVEQSQPIEGKAYDVTRVGEALQVRTAAGGDPPPEEVELVSAAMAALGRPNALGQLLNGKTLQVGQQIAVPNDIVREFFGERAADGAMQLTLDRVSTGPVPRATFVARLNAPPSSAGDPGMDVSGRWEVDTTTCQTLAAHFQGPIHAVELKGPTGAQYQVITRGELELRLARNPTTFR